jgi:hypothetical protein
MSQHMSEPVPASLHFVGVDLSGRSRCAVHECDCGARWINVDIVSGFRSWLRDDEALTDIERAAARPIRTRFWRWWYGE